MLSGKAGIFFMIALAGLVLAGCTSNAAGGSGSLANNSSGAGTNASNGGSSGAGSGGNSGGGMPVISMNEVAKHNTFNDCWMVINGMVLNLSDFTAHPGGETYLPYCGKDGTDAYNTKGGRGPPHSVNANSYLTMFQIGVVG